MKNLIASLFLSLAFAGSVVAAPDEFSSTTISVGVVTSDLGKSLEFYTNVVGMVRTGSFDVDEGFAKKSGLTDGTPLHVEVLRLGEGDDATQWKLMTFGKRAKQQKDKYILGHTGMQYITIMVNDLTPFVERIKKNKVKLLGETPTPLGGDNHFVLIQDPDGVFVELIGPMK
jgi:catechol 2,3-dioxygenase-like lactoylglutathione lyase family enzyme